MVNGLRLEGEAGGAAIARLTRSGVQRKRVGTEHVHRLRIMKGHPPPPCSEKGESSRELRVKHGEAEGPQEGRSGR